MRWIQGESKPSKGVFLRLVDFIAEETRKAGRLPPARQPKQEKNSGKS